MTASAGAAGEDSASYSLLNIKRYRRYFNVDTEVGAPPCRGQSFDQSPLYFPLPPLFSYK